MTHLEYFEIISKMKRHGTTNLLALIPIFGYTYRLPYIGPDDYLLGESLAFSLA